MQDAGQARRAVSTHSLRGESNRVRLETGTKCGPGWQSGRPCDFVYSRACEKPRPLTRSSWTGQPWKFCADESSSHRESRFYRIVSSLTVSSVASFIIVIYRRTRNIGVAVLRRYAWSFCIGNVSCHDTFFFSFFFILNIIIFLFYLFVFLEFLYRVLGLIWV